MVLSICQYSKVQLMQLYHEENTAASLEFKFKLIEAVISHYFLHFSWPVFRFAKYLFILK